jgi:DtxR family transcriptional regulator, manganese transport regulator
MQPMKEPRRFADGHRRTRRDHAAETAEDYVEAISEVLAQKGVCRVTDLARRFDVSHVTVTKIIARLKENGLVNSEPYKPLELTEAGRRLAAKSRRRHEIVHQFLLSIGVSESVAAVDSEGIEHHVSPETLEAMRAFVDSAAIDQK